MDDLPDDAVLAVLRHLDVSALLACRLVCRRLGGLVVHPDLWRHRRVSAKDPWLLPALQLAPCLDEMEVELAHAGRRVVCYTATRCAAVTLRLTASFTCSCLPGALLLNTQLALGRLKHLHLDLQVHFAKKGVFDASVLLAAVASSYGLQTLVVLVSEIPRPSWAPTASFIGDLGKLDIAQTVHPPSLRHFHCRLIPNLEPFINHILVAHAATLKVIELVNPDGSLHSPVTAPLLAALPKLSSRESENVMGPLPDDEVLKVLQYLDVPDLLACRLVCRRLGGLALHPDAWRHRRLSHEDPWLRPALRLAPCLDELEVDLALANPCGQEVLDCMTTACAAAELRLAVKDYSSCYEVGALMVSKQVTLGRLKRLHVALDNPLSLDDASVLIAAVAFSSSLETLVVSGICRSRRRLSGLHLSTTTSHPPSLQHLRCPLQPGLVYFINHMLNAHAETLETVDLLLPNSLRTSKGGYPMVTLRMMEGLLDPGLECGLLAGMPHLRRLECGLLPGLQAAAECTSLTEVTLWVSGEMRDHAADAEEFLARASQLRSVSLTYRRRSSGKRESAGIGAGLILALTRQPARSQLESLVADNDGDLDDSQLRPFLDALPSLPALRHLEMNGVLHGVLPDRVSPDRTPALRTLRLLPAMGRAPNCVHGYVHSPALSALLDNNPALEVHVCAPYYCETTAKPCSWCAMACHRRELPDAVWETPNKWPYAKLPGHLWVNVTRFVQHLKRKFPQ